MNNTLTKTIFETSNCPFNNPYQGNAPRVLFVCSAGLLRSATAATLGSVAGLNTRNCGSHREYALIPLSANLINWAEHIIFINKENEDRANEDFFNNFDLSQQLREKGVTWDIPDSYPYMDPKLQELLIPLLNSYFNKATMEDFILQNPDLN